MVNKSRHLKAVNGDDLVYYTSPIELGKEQRYRKECVFKNSINSSQLSTK